MVLVVSGIVEGTHQSASAQKETSLRMGETMATLAPSKGRIFDACNAWHARDEL